MRSKPPPINVLHTNYDTWTISFPERRAQTAALLPGAAGPHLQIVCNGVGWLMNTQFVSDSLTESTSPTPETAMPFSDLGLLDAYSKAVVSTVRQAGPAVVHIQARAGKSHQGGSGSGFLISPDGFVMTNSHVVHGADEVRAQTPDGRESRAYIIGDDPDTDLAVLRIDLPELHHLQFAHSGQLVVGQIAIAIGKDRKSVV